EFLLSLKRETEALAERHNIRTVLEQPGKTPANLKVTLQRVRESVPEAQEIFCADPQGRVIAGSSEEILARDVTGSLWFERGKQSFYPGDVVRDQASGRIQWRMSTPVKDSSN